MQMCRKRNAQLAFMLQSTVSIHILCRILSVKRVVVSTRSFHSTSPVLPTQSLLQSGWRTTPLFVLLFVVCYICVISLLICSPCRRDRGTPPPKALGYVAEFRAELTPDSFHAPPARQGCSWPYIYIYIYTYIHIYTYLYLSLLSLYIYIDIYTHISHYIYIYIYIYVV